MSDLKKKINYTVIRVVTDYFLQQKQKKVIEEKRF